MGSTTAAGNLASQLGGSVLGSVVGEGMGLLFNGINNQNQLNQQGKLDAQQLGYNEQDQAYQQQLQMQTWNQTNYPAQVAQLQAAGLNPALLYGKGGGGGATTGATGSGGIQGAMAPSTSTGQTAQMAMMSAETQADINLKNAQAQNLQAKTPQEAPLMNSQIASITQGVQNQQAQRALTEAQTTAQAIQNHIQGESQDDQITTIRIAATTADTELQQAVRNNWMDQNTKDDKMSIIHATMLGAYMQNNATQAGINLTNEQIQQASNSIAQQWKQLNINQQNANTGLYNAATQRGAGLAQETQADTQQRLMQLQKYIQDMPMSQQMMQMSVDKLIPQLFGGAGNINITPSPTTPF